MAVRLAPDGFEPWLSGSDPGIDAALQIVSGLAEDELPEIRQAGLHRAAGCASWLIALLTKPP
jgi:hypothetical protein